MAHRFPLEWPRGWTRTEHRTSSRFKAATSKALPLLTGEVGRMGGSGLVITTNLPLKADGTFRLDRDPVDPGAAVYFRRGGKDVVFACDQFDELRENVYAIAKTIEAMRAIERYGAAELVDRAFSGFLGLPAVASEGEDCWSILGLAPMSTMAAVKAVHHSLTRKLHAEGAASEEFARINVARDEAFRALAAQSKEKK
jgi:hypothetical protein